MRILDMRIEQEWLLPTAVPTALESHHFGAPIGDVLRILRYISADGLKVAKALQNT